MENTQESKEQINKTPIKPMEWLEEESKSTPAPSDEFEKKPSLQFQENKIVEFTVDYSKPFEKWDDTVNKVQKAIIPVNHNGVIKNLWLNVRNPLYSDIVNKGLKGITKFKVLQVGNQANTKYTVIEE